MRTLALATLICLLYGCGAYTTPERFLIGGIVLVNVADVVQTNTLQQRGYVEVDPITSRILGAHPSSGELALLKVVVLVPLLWGIAQISDKRLRQLALFGVLCVSAYPVVLNQRQICAGTRY